MRHAILFALGLAVCACSINVDYTGPLPCDGSDCGGANGPAPTCSAAIGAGGGHTCAVLDDGIGYCWGDNHSGQLGNNAKTDSATPVAIADPSKIDASKPALPKLASIAGGAQHTCAIDVNGAVWCWGSNDESQLGNGSDTQSSIPVQITLPAKATRIVAGQSHTCALLAGGAIACWGANERGQLGNGHAGGVSTTPSTASLGGATALAAGGNTTCAVDASKTVQCWGSNGDGEFGMKADSDPHPVAVAMPIVVGAVDVAIGNGFSCAMTDIGDVYCMGHNDVGQIGNPYGGNLESPNKVPLTAVAKQLSAADRVACVVDDQKHVWCWGANDNYELADGTNENRAFPVRSNFGDAEEVVVGSSSGGAYVCVRAVDGLRCAGYDGTGGLGDGIHTIYSQASPVTAPATGTWQVASLALGDGFSCALLGDGHVDCWGGNWTGQVGDGTYTGRAVPTPVVGLAGVKQIAVGEFHACALMPDTTVMCWGHNDSGQLGDGSFDPHSEPRPVASGFDTAAGRALPTPLTGVVGLTGGSRHTCAVMADGGIRCWGSNQFKQLGDNVDTTDHTTPFTMTLPVAMMGATAVTAGDVHTCAIDKNSKAWCWGSNNDGQLGVKDAVPMLTAVPTAVVGLDGQVIDQLVTVDSFTCAHATSNQVWCWGFNSDGELGKDKDYSFDYTTPQLIQNLAFKKIATGSVHACGLTTGGLVLCWGGNYLGQTSTEVYEGLALKTQVNVTGAIDIAVGGGHSCAILGDKTVQCWGDGREGELGNGVMARQTPVAPMLTCPE